MKSKHIPKSFQLGGKTYTVKIDNDINYDVSCHGVHEPYLQKISLADTIRNKKISQEHVEETFYHELVHAILTMISNEDLNKDEDFVNRFSAMLYQYMKTKKL